MSISKIQCSYCNNLFSNHILAKHENKCVFNLTNSKLILEFIFLSNKNPKELSKSKYQVYAKANNLLSSKTLMISLKKDTWNKALVCLILKFYKAGYIEDLEYFDEIIYKLTYKTMLYDNETLTALQEKIFIEELESCGFNLSEVNFTNQYENLYAAIVIRAVRDLTSLTFQDKLELTEQEKFEAFSFLKTEVPLILNKLKIAFPNITKYATT